MHTNKQLFCASNFVKSHTSVSTLYVSFFHFFIRILVNIFLGYKDLCLLLCHNQFVFLCKELQSVFLHNQYDSTEQVVVEFNERL